MTKPTVVSKFEGSATRQVLWNKDPPLHIFTTILLTDLKFFQLLTLSMSSCLIQTSLIQKTTRQDIERQLSLVYIHIFKGILMLKYTFFCFPLAFQIFL